MLVQMIEQIGREKNIEPEVIVAAIEEAMTVAAQKFYRTEDYLEARLDPETGEVAVHSVKRVVDDVQEPTCEVSVEEARAVDPKLDIGDDLRVALPTDQLGRIAAQAAKQVIFQKVRDAERDNIHAEYIERVGELLTGVVKRFERGDMVVDLGRTEAVLPRREQSRAEHYNLGDRIRVVIVDVLRATRGPQVVVSRASSELLRRLFELEVPEIYDKTVGIKAAVREAGDRAKVAVYSLDADIDPVGACVGMRGARVQQIIRELRGEKIDIVDWSDDPEQFAVNALKPARVNRVTEHVVVAEDGREEKRLEVFVDEDQLSLAIGKRGQNVRLAGKLLGRKIDITSEGGPVAADEEYDAVSTPLAGIEGLLEDEVVALCAGGLESVEGVLAAGEDQLLALPGIDPERASTIIEILSRFAAGGSSGDEPADQSEEPGGASEDPEDGAGKDDGESEEGASES